MEVVEKNKKNILFLLGQLAAVKANPSLLKFNLNLSVFKYDNSSWTTSVEDLIHLAILGHLADQFIPIMIDGNNYTVPVKARRIEPTLSPKDPNFDKWWAEHKTEWED